MYVHVLVCMYVLYILPLVLPWYTFLERQKECEYASLTSDMSCMISYVICEGMYHVCTSYCVHTCIHTYIHTYVV
jgi:hypothetical protein